METIARTSNQGGAPASNVGLISGGGAGQTVDSQASPPQQPAQVLNVVVNATYTGGNHVVTTEFEGLPVKITSSSGTVSKVTNAKGRAVFESVPCGEVVSIQLYNGEHNEKGRSKTFKRRFDCGSKAVTVNVDWGDYEGHGWALGRPKY